MPSILKLSLFEHRVNWHRILGLLDLVACTALLLVDNMLNWSLQDVSRSGWDDWDLNLQRLLHFMTLNKNYAFLLGGLCLMLAVHIFQKAKLTTKRKGSGG